MKQINAYKKSLMVLAFSFFVVTGAFAQFSVGFEYALPMGSPFSDGVNGGIGGSIRYDGAINDNLAWGGYFGYQSYSLKAANYNVTLMPIQAGIKYYFTEMNAGFYGGLDLGIFIGGSNFPGAVSESKFGFTPAIGYRLSSFDIGVRYNLVTDANNLAFRLAYVFGGGK